MFSLKWSLTLTLTLTLIERRSLSNGSTDFGKDFYLPEDYRFIEWRRACDFDQKPTCVAGQEGAYDPTLIKLPENAEEGGSPVDDFTISLMKTFMGASVERYFMDKKITKSGMYELELPDPNDVTRMVKVSVDDYFPCFQGQPAFVAMGVGRSLWPLLLRKAIAKLFGGYLALPTMTCFDSGLPCPFYRAPLELEKKVLCQGQIDALQAVLGSPANHVELPNDAALFKAAQECVLPCRSYVEPPGNAQGWYGWLPKNPIFLLMPHSRELIVSREDKIDDDYHFFVMLLVSKPILTAAQIELQENVNEEHRQKQEMTGDKLGEPRKVGSAYRKDSEDDAIFGPWGAAVGDEISSTKWALDSYYCSHHGARKSFKLVEGCAYAFTVMEANATSSLWGAQPGDWRYLTMDVNFTQ